MPAPGEFYDHATGGKLEIDLRSSRPGQFKLLRKFAYIDPKYPNDPFIVPRDLQTWETDLASIPRYFTWLVPGLGVHLPAILLHDGLVVDDKNAIEHDGPPVSREEADRILRDAMRELKTPLVRRWLIWTAVIMATAWLDLKPAWRWRGLWLATIGTILTLGTIATLDLFDIWNVLPWMGDRVWWQELLFGGVFAVVIPLAISILWGRLRIAAAVLGISFALLLHVTVAIAALYAVYETLERLAHRFDDARLDPTAATEVTPTGASVGSTVEGN